VEAELARRGWTLERVGAAAYGCAQGGWRAHKGGITRGGYRLEHVVEQVREHDAWEAERMQQYILNEIITGDARALAPSIPDASVDLVFTDPVYDRIEDYRWLAETAARVLKPGGALLAFYGIGNLPETHAALQAGGLTYRWRFVIRSLFGAGSGQWHGRLQAGTKEAAWYEKGKSKLHAAIFDLLTISHNERAGLRVAGAVWGKTLSEVIPFVAAFTTPGALVYDPFAGGGTVPAVCKMLGRTFLASEIDPATAERARERLANTQPPLPGLVVEQAGLDLSAA
jgi:hypothetical protein